MYWNILKKDLKRKKTMNLILLIFIILAATFVSSSVNNIIAVTTALDTFFEKAGMTDYFAATIDKTGTVFDTKILDECEAVDSYGIEHILYANPDNFRYKGEKLETVHSTSVLMSFSDAVIHFFDEENQQIGEVKPGTVLISGKMIRENNMQVGDRITIRFGETSAEFKIAGSFKDAMLGSNMMGMTRFLLNENDYQIFASDKKISQIYGGSLIYISTQDNDAVKKVLNTQESYTTFTGDRNMIKMTYVMDIIIAGVLLVVSVCLILIAFVILQFTIRFTLSEEYREIGVMKAIGIGNRKIRGLYLVKYFALAVTGACIGFFLSISFAKMMTDKVSQSIVIETEHGYLINMLCSALIVLIVMLFCVICTGKVKKFTPIDAIHNGTTGERFRKKSLIRLGKSVLKPSGFMAVNDILSSPRRFATIILTFALCLMQVLILVNTTNTLKSDSLITSFGMAECDVCLVEEDKQMRFMGEKNGRELLEKEIADIEQKLAENGMPAECYNEAVLRVTILHGENVSKPLTFQGIGTTTDRYVYYEGTPPQNANEIAVTKATAEELGATIGDTVTIRQTIGEDEYMITALYQSMNNMGEGVRMHEDAEVDYLQTAGFFPFQIQFTDYPTDEEIERRIEKIKDILGTDIVETAAENVERTVGVSGMIDKMIVLVLTVILIIIMLITILMEQSFIAKERSEIAILKAIGFGNRAIIRWHTLRFGIAAVLSMIPVLLLIQPITNIAVGPIFKMMGADFGIRYEIVTLQVYVIYPALVLTVTLVSAFLAAQNIRRIEASETSGIE